jgi:hypothetical protein
MGTNLPTREVDAGLVDAGGVFLYRHDPAIVQRATEPDLEERRHVLGG